MTASQYLKQIKFNLVGMPCFVDKFINCHKWKSSNRMLKTDLKILFLLFAVFLTVSFSLPVQAQTTTEFELDPDEVMSLEQAIDISVANNTDIKRALLSVMDADEQVRIAWSEVMPNVSTSATYTRNLEIPVNFLPAEFFGGEAGELIPVAFGTDNNWTGGVTVSQNIFRGEAIVGISSSALYKSAQQENLRATLQQVVTETRKAYYRVLVAEEQLRLQQATVQRIRQNLEENQKRYQAGLVDEYDVLRLEVQLSNQQPLIREAEYNVEQAYRDLKQLLGIPVDMPFKSAGNLNQFDILSEVAAVPENESLKKIDRFTSLPPSDDREVVSTMREQRGDLRMLDVQDELKDREILAIKSRFLPTVTADYNLRWTSAQAGAPVFFEDARRYQTIALTVSLPLFEGFQRRAILSRAFIEKKDIREQQEATERAAKNEYESAKENLDRLFETAAARQKALEQARRGYEIALQRYNEGIGAQIEVNEAELEVREAELNYAQMVFDYLSAKADYDFALGLVPKADQVGSLVNNY